MLPAEVTVLRDGKNLRIPSSALVPGDIVDLVLGQKVPADVRVSTALPSSTGCPPLDRI